MHAQHGEVISCHWCGKSLEWSGAVVDHLNENKQGNRPENLVVACSNCNRARGAVVPFIRGIQPASRQLFLNTVDELWRSAEQAEA